MWPAVRDPRGVSLRPYVTGTVLVTHNTTGPQNTAWQLY
jgi:hypothetical protein